MANITVLELRIGERAESKLAVHGITARQVEELVHSRLITLANRKRRAAPFIVIGGDHNGRCITVPVMPTEDRTAWRVVTACYCKPSEAAKLR